tara:strand:+ start:2645 stop:3097 length:453 start_codon:yes stop_codon:yes gene_type:complete
VIGGVSLLAALGTGAALLRFKVGWSPLLLAFPFLFLISGWAALLFGLFQLEGPRRVRSVARGRFAAFGLALILASAPVPASLVVPARVVGKAFTCYSCGARGHLHGAQNAWGTWLESSVRLGGQAATPPRGWQQARKSCDHAASLPWEPK